jgi:GH24 family phage-related lysozyme (muramidase)
MKPRLKATRAARELIKAYEPFVPEAVQRGRRFVVGYGHTAAAKPGVTVSRQDAELLLIYDVSRAEATVKAAVGDDLAPAARDALISFAASVGTGAFKVSDVARLAAAGRHEDAAKAMESWVRAEEDGRLVVSERLKQRRRAEKTLYLEGLSGAPAQPQTDAEEPRLGALIDVDIAFESPEEDEAVAAPAAEPVAEEPAPEAEAPAAEEAAPEVERELEPEPPIEPSAQAEEQPETAAQPDRKAEQDAAIQAVMARMAEEISGSIGAAPVATEPQDDAEPAVPDPAPDYSGVRLGFSYLTPATVSVEPEADAEVQHEPEPEPRPEAKPEPVAASMPGPVYATVSVGPYTPPAEIAPPHPAEAPAKSGGLSGESEGPDHDEGEEAYASGEDDMDLEPAIVAGPEAPGEHHEAPMPSEGRGDWVYTANLAVGLGLTGYGAWELISNMDAYLAAGLDFSLIGPVAFGAGVLLSAASGWYVIGAMRRKG